MRHQRLIAVCLLALGRAGAAPRLARLEPASGCYLGAFIEHDSLARGDCAVFERLVGRRHACYIQYTGYGRPFPQAWVSKVAAHGAAAHLAMEPNRGLEPVKDDDYLRGWARAAKASGIPIFLRFASEMNGTWMAYSGNPALYREKFALVARVMHEEAPNVALVWCPFSTPRDNIPRYYPGDEAVDWVGVNIYSVYYHNNDPGEPGHHEDPRDELRSVYDRYAATKPIMICEYAATHWSRAVGGQTTRFATDKMSLLYSALPVRFPRVKCVQWFSWDAFAANAADNDYSLTTNPAVTAIYRRLTESAHYLETVVGQPQRLRTALVTPVVAPPATARQVVKGTPLPRLAPVAKAPPRALGPTGPLPPDSEDPDVLRPLRALCGLVGLRPRQRVTAPVEMSVYYPEDWDVRFVTAQLNGQTVFATNRPPFRFVWDPAGLEPGRYELRVRFLRAVGDPVYSPILDVEVRRPL